MNTRIISALLFIFISTVSAEQKNSLSPLAPGTDALGNQPTCAKALTSRGTKNQCNTPRLTEFSQVTQFKLETTTGLTSDKTLSRRGTRYKSVDNPESNNALFVTRAKLYRRGSR